MSLLSKVSRIVKPGMFGAVLVGVAITAAATYTAKLSIELDTTLDAVDKARLELDELETRRASAIIDIEGFEIYRDQMIKEMRERMTLDIACGAYDSAVGERWNAINVVSQAAKKPGIVVQGKNSVDVQ